MTNPEMKETGMSQIVSLLVYSQEHFCYQHNGVL